MVAARDLLYGLCRCSSHDTFRRLCGAHETTIDDDKRLSPVASIATRLGV